MSDAPKLSPPKAYTLLKKVEKEGSKVLIEAEIPHDELHPFRKKALDTLRQSVEIDGFRKGKASDEVLEKHVGEFTVLERTAQEALAEIYPRILADHDIDAVGHPHISVTKLAPGNALVFTAETAVMPEIKLTDYKKIAEKSLGALSAPDLLPTDEEVEKSLLNVRRRLAHQEWHEAHPEDTEHGHGEIKDEELPVLTDEGVQKLGSPYSTVAEIKEESRKAIVEDKKQREASRRRAAIADGLVAGTPFTIPDVFVEGELGMMLGEFKQTIAHMGLTLQGYLEHIKKTEEDLHKEWRPDAEKRARLQLILNRIADVEKIAPADEKIQHEVAHLLEHHKGAKEENVRNYVESMMRNDMVFNFLEGKKEEK